MLITQNGLKNLSFQKISGLVQQIRLFLQSLREGFYSLRIITIGVNAMEDTIVKRNRNLSVGKRLSDWFGAIEILRKEGNVNAANHADGMLMDLLEGTLQKAKGKSALAGKLRVRVLSS